MNKKSILSTILVSTSLLGLYESKIYANENILTIESKNDLNQLENMNYVSLTELNPIKIRTGNNTAIKINKNLSNNTIGLKIDNQIKFFEEGITSQASSTLVYDISEYSNIFDRFRCYLGIDASQPKGEVKFIISVSNDNEHWNTLKTIDCINGSQNAKYIDLNIKGYKYIKLYADQLESDWWDHAVYANPILCKEKYIPNDKILSTLKTTKDYDKDIKNKYLNSKEVNIELQNLLRLRTFVSRMNYDNLQRLANKSDVAKEALDYLIDNQNNSLDLWLQCGTLEKNGSVLNSLNEWIKLFAKYKNDFSNPLYLKIAIAISISHGNKIKFWTGDNAPSIATERYEAIKYLYTQGYMKNGIRTGRIADFETLPMELLRWVTNNQLDNKELIWLAKYALNIKQLTSGLTYLDAYHYINYRNGYDYSKDEFHDLNKALNYDLKYNFKSLYKSKDEYKNKNIQHLWQVFEDGAVCGGISKTYANLNQVFGTPAAVVGQPAHASTLVMNKKNKKIHWELHNDVGTVARAEKGERLPLDWGSVNRNQYKLFYYNVPYIYLSSAALDDEKNYYKANQYCLLADIFNDIDIKLELYKKSLTIQPYNLDAIYGILTCLKAKNVSDDIYYKLGKYVSKEWKNYPTPFKDMMDNLKNQIKDVQYDIAIDSLISKTLNDMKNRKDSEYIQATECRSVANFILGNENNEVATFSFDGNYPGIIRLNDQYKNSTVRWEYSLDGDKTRKSTNEKELKLSKEELEKINANDDIIISLVGTDAKYRIDIKDFQLDNNIHVNDLENRLVGQNVKLEYRKDDNDEWQPYTDEVRTYGDAKIQVRSKAQGVHLPSPAKTYEFKKATDSDQYHYIPLSHVTLDKFCSQHNTSNEAAKNMLDGNKNTMWHNDWGGNDKRYYSVKFDKERLLSKVEYLPRQSGGTNGNLKSVTIYTSMDGQNWNEQQRFDNLDSSTSLKEFKLDKPVKAKYVMLYANENYGGNLFSGSMLNFYEDVSTEMKDWKEKINHCTYLSDEERTQALSALDELKSGQIVEKVQQEDKKRYDDAVAKLEKELAQCHFIDDKEKEKVTQALKKALTKEEMTNLHQALMKANEDNQTKERSEARDYIDKIDDLNHDEKEAIDKQIDQSQSHNGLVALITKVKKEVTDRVTKAYEKAKALIADERELSKEQDQEALEALNNIDTVAEANEIYDKVKQESDQLLEKRKQQAKDVVKEMKYVSSEQKDQVYKAIQEVKHSDELARIISDTQSYDNVESAKDLEDAKSKAKDLLANADAFSKEEKEKITTELGKSKDKEAVAKLSEQIVETQVKRVEQAKKETEKTLARVDLTDEEKAIFQKELKEAKTLAAVKKAGEYAKERHQYNLEQVKALASTFVSTLDNITSEERQRLQDHLKAVNDYDDIHQALETAVKENDERLVKEKETVTEAINDLSHLKEKEQWLALVDHVRTVNEAKELLELAKKADEWYKNDVTDARTQAKAIINDFKYMNEENKKLYCSKVDAAKTREQLEILMTEAVRKEQQLWQKALQKAKEDANKELEALTSLTSEQQKVVKKALEEAQSENDVKNIMNKAKKHHDDMIAHEFKLYKNTIKEMIEQLDELTYLEVKEFKKQVDAAKNKDEVQVIFAKAQKQNTDNAVNKAIDIATKTIASLTGLTTQQRQSYTRQVKEADSINEVNTIVAKAKAQEKENKQKPKFNKKENYIHFKKDSYTLWKDLNFKAKKGKSKDYMNQTLKMKGYYVVNGSKYASIYNYQDQWLGYINMDNVVVDNHAGGAYVKYERYVTVTKDNYTLWKDFDFDVKKGTTKSMKGHTYIVKGYYRHFNGSVYYSLYNGKNQWVGYINKNGVTLGGAEGTLRVGMHQGVKKYKQVVKKDYFFWKSFEFKKKKGSTTAWYKKNLYVSGQYEHINGNIYCSIYDKQGGRWLGYVNRNALS